ncbi:hypothetical protein F5882DRAFT_20773 [Hyaloscypha sp. PMI_1271]|nr:hypothetical protein F5882DRAFT_20773 [Hyaloscypha sp. PMI_1271]
MPRLHGLYPMPSLVDNGCGKGSREWIYSAFELLSGIWLLKHERKESIMFLASDVRLPDSPEGSTKASEDESKRRKGHSHHKFTERHLSKHVDDESRWFEAISKRCDDLTKFSTQRTQCIGSLETLDFENGIVIAEISADSMPRNRRMQIRN